MTSYLDLLLLILPVFGVMAVGVVMRRKQWLKAEADASFLRLLVNVLYPCIIFTHVFENPALREPTNLGWAPLMGFLTMSAGMVICYGAGRMLGFTIGNGLRTFAFTVGIYNYSYITVPVMEDLFGPESIGVLFVHNLGCEVAIWVVGILILSGQSLRTGWRKLFNAPIFALIFSITVNLSGAYVHVPESLMVVIRALAACAIPFGLILSGATLGEQMARKTSDLFDLRTSLAAVTLRLGVLTLLMLLVARYGPFSDDLRHVIVVQAVMPAGFISMVLVNHYGGHPLVAARVVIATVFAGILLIPFWLRFALAWVG